MARPRKDSNVLEAEPVSPVRAEMEWYMCPRCKGRGEIFGDFKRKPVLADQPGRQIGVCARCNGWGVERVEQGQAKGFFPVRQCGKCKNYYAIGAAGMDDYVPTLQETEHTHSHLYDVSVHAPPANPSLLRTQNLAIDKQSYIKPY